MILRRVAAALLLASIHAGGLTAGSPPKSSDQEERRLCAQKMRRVYEAIQAYRRLHNGAYPDKIASLVRLELISQELTLCPCIVQGTPFNVGPDDTWSSAGRQYDPELSYQYEMSATKIKPHLLPPGVTATWRDLKTRLIERPYWEQIPLLRCSRHSREGKWLNLSFSGQYYESGQYWDELFTDSVPFTYRSSGLAFTREAPPFVTTAEAALLRPLGSISLAPVCNARPEDPWWWGGPQGPNGERTATLQALLRKCPDGLFQVDGAAFDIRFVAQTQGYVPPSSEAKRSFVLRCFPPRITLPLRQKLLEVRLLGATVWPDKPGKTVGTLTWNYEDGTTATFPLIFGEKISCFRERDKNPPLPRPCWQHEDTQLFLFCWNNPHPAKQIQSVELAASPDAIAAPFLLSITNIPTR